DLNQFFHISLPLKPDHLPRGIGRTCSVEDLLHADTVSKGRRAGYFRISAADGVDNDGCKGDKSAGKAGVRNAGQRRTEVYLYLTPVVISGGCRKKLAAVVDPH